MNTKYLLITSLAIAGLSNGLNAMNEQPSFLEHVKTSVVNWINNPDRSWNESYRQYEVNWIWQQDLPYMKRPNPVELAELQEIHRHTDEEEKEIDLAFEKQGTINNEIYQLYNQKESAQKIIDKAQKEIDSYDEQIHGKDAVFIPIYENSRKANEDRLRKFQKQQELLSTRIEELQEEMFQIDENVYGPLQTRIAEDLMQAHMRKVKESWVRSHHNPFE